MTTYSWQSQFTGKVKADAQDVGERLERLRREQRRPLMPDDIVADAKRKSSVLHSFFEWDDAEAARQFRMRQAGTLAGALQRSETDARGRTIQYRAYVRVRNPDLPRAERWRTPKLLVPSDMAMADAEMRAEILHRAMHEAERLAGRWQHLKQFAHLRGGGDHQAGDRPPVAPPSTPAGPGLIFRCRRYVWPRPFPWTPPRACDARPTALSPRSSRRTRRTTSMR